MYRRTYVKINNNQLKNNVKLIISKYYDYKYYIGVVKGNAYGHGNYVVNDLIKGGVNYLAVSSLEEAIDIRKYNSSIPILCMEPIELNYIKEVIKYNITITIESINYLQKINDLDIEKEIKVHLKIDTGMNRLGIKKADELEKAIKLIKSNPMLFLEGMYTHLATSGTADKQYDIQIQNFKKLTKNVHLEDIPIIHMNRSITLSRHNKYPFETGTRLGIMMYGFDNSVIEPRGLRKIKFNIIKRIKKISPIVYSNKLKLRTAFSLYTTIMSIKKVNKGELIGYGGNYKAKENIIIAILPIGYYDGIDSKMKYVSINSKKYEIIGETCMDMITIKIDESVKIGDKVELFGNDISIRGISGIMKTNAYHIFTNITTRVPRVYDDGTEIKY